MIHQLIVKEVNTKIFCNQFQGKHVELKLKVYSSFAEEMITDAVSTVPFDPQFRFEHAVADGRTVIMSQERSYIGKVVFDPAAGCQQEEACYCGFSIHSKRKLKITGFLH